jgi:hypothetical protein
LTLAAAAGTIRRNLDPGPTLSQYPTPYPPQQPVHGGYQPPTPGYQPPTPDQLLAPARRSGVLMIVLGVLFVFCGLCMAGSSWMMGQPEFESSPEFAEARKQFALVEQQTGVSMQTMLIVAGAIPLALGALFGALGFFVRGGGFVPVMLGIVLSAMLLLFFGLGILGTVVQSMGNPAQLLGACVYVVPFALLALNVVWLIQAARASSQIAGARQQYQAQLWQYQQYQEAYRQNAQQQGYPQVPPQQPGGMGYQYPPPAQPPAAQQPVPQPPAAQLPAAQPPVPPPAPKDPSDGPPPQG